MKKNDTRNENEKEISGDKLLDKLIVILAIAVGLLIVITINLAIETNKIDKEIEEMHNSYFTLKSEVEDNESLCAGISKDISDILEDVSIIREIQDDGISEYINTHNLTDEDN